MSLILIPIKFESEVVAVLELAGFAPSRKKTSTSWRASRWVRGSPSAPSIRRRRRELLQTSQAQTEELQAQKKNLRAANDQLMQREDQLTAQNAELEETTEELRSQQEELRATSERLEGQSEALEVKTGNSGTSANRYRPKPRNWPCRRAISQSSWRTCRTSFVPR